MQFERSNVELLMRAKLFREREKKTAAPKEASMFNKEVLGDRRRRNVPVSYQLYVKLPCGNMFDGDTERVVEKWYWSGTLLGSWSLATGKPWALMPVSLVLGFAA